MLEIVSPPGRLGRTGRGTFGKRHCFLKRSVSQHWQWCGDLAVLGSDLAAEMVVVRAWKGS